MPGQIASRMQLFPPPYPPRKRERVGWGQQHAQNERTFVVLKRKFSEREGNHDESFEGVVGLGDTAGRYWCRANPGSSNLRESRELAAARRRLDHGQILWRRNIPTT